jgi:Holliday junction DNA helicase RuvA
MIATIQGEVIALEPNALVIRVGGVGLRVFVPTMVSAGAHIGDELFLHTHLVVREDLLNLYGFDKQEDRQFFELLLGVNGVGPRLALAVLSSLNVDTIRRAVLSEQADVFSRVPGVGKKTGQKILLHLQGKVGTTGEVLGGILTDVDSEVLEALTGLGYSVVEAQAALQSIPRDTPQEVETRLRLALQYFSG